MNLVCVCFRRGTGELRQKHRTLASNYSCSLSKRDVEFFFNLAQFGVHIFRFVGFFSLSSALIRLDLVVVVTRHLITVRHAISQ